ncbi:MAG: tetratricopeptide repeat protein [Dongiaceae bacterium]
MPEKLTSLFERARRRAEAGDWPTAHQDVDALLALGQDDAAAIGLATMILARSGETERAIAQLRAAVDRMPGDASLAGNLANALFETGAHREALEWHNRAIAINPESAGLQFNRALALRALGEREQGMAALRQVLRLEPGHDRARRMLASACAESGAMAEAERLYADLLVRRDDAALRIRAATLLPPILPSLEVIPDIRRRFEANLDGLIGSGLKIESPGDVGSTCFFLAYHGENELALQRRIADLYLEVCPALPFTAAHCAIPARSAAGRRLRIGFLSANLRAHTIGRLFRDLIGGLDPARFETILFRRPGLVADDVAQEIDRSVARIVPIATDLRTAQQQIADCELDVMVYPDIGMDMATFSLAFARLAPVQCVAWGHPVTTGIPTVDYFISWDRWETAEADTHYSERLVRLRALPVCYRRPDFDPVRMKRARFGLPADKTLYLCLQTLFKFHPSFDPTIAAILRGDPNGLLVLIEGQWTSWKNLLLKRFCRSIPDVVDRIRFVPPQSNEDFLALTAIGDVVLDPPVFGGGNTTLEALAAGRPVVTLPGPYLRSRIAQGFLRHVGEDRLVAADIAEYVRLALEWGRMERARRADENRLIAERAAPLFGQPAIIGEYEAFFRAALEASASGRRLAAWPI